MFCPSSIMEMLLFQNIGCKVTPLPCVAQSLFVGRLFRCASRRPPVFAARALPARGNRPSGNIFVKNPAVPLPFKKLAVLLHSLNGTAASPERSAVDILTGLHKTGQVQEAGALRSRLSFFCTR